MSTSTTFRPTVVPDRGDVRILARRRAPALTLRLVALSATVVAATPLAAFGIDAGQPAKGVTVGPVRFEPLPGSDGLTVTGVGTYRGVIEVARNGAGLSVVDD